MVSGSGGLSLLQAILAPLAAYESTDEVIVTAQRRRERHQDVPIALSVMGQDELARRGARDLSDLAGAAPLAITAMAYNAANLGVQVTVDVLYGVKKLRDEKGVLVKA